MNSLYRYKELKVEEIAYDEDDPDDPEGPDDGAMC